MKASYEIQKLNTLWDTMLRSGMNDPSVNIAQISILIFLKKLDRMEQKKEEFALLFEMEVIDPLFSPLQETCRWSRFLQFEPMKLYRTMMDKVFPFLQYELKPSKDTVYSKYLQQITFRFTTPEVLYETVHTIDDIDFDDIETANLCYTSLLSKITPNSEKGQFYTPPSLVNLMIQLTNPGIQDKICDPASGTGNILAAAAKSVYSVYKNEFMSQEIRTYFETSMFSGFDYDHTMTEIAAMNLSLAGVTEPNLRTLDALSEKNCMTDEFTLILSHIPFTTTTDQDLISESLLSGSHTSNTAVLFFRLILRMMKHEARCAVIVPDVLLFGIRKANKAIKEDLMNKHRIDAVISLSNLDLDYFKQISCSLLLFTKDVPEGSNRVWYYNLTSVSQIPDLINRYFHPEEEEQRTRMDNSFFVSRDEIVKNEYMLIMDRYMQSGTAEEHLSALESVQALDQANTLLRNSLFQFDYLR